LCLPHAPREISTLFIGINAESTVGFPSKFINPGLIGAKTSRNSYRDNSLFLQITESQSCLLSTVGISGILGFPKNRANKVVKRTREGSPILFIEPVLESLACVYLYNSSPFPSCVPGALMRPKNGLRPSYGRLVGPIITIVGISRKYRNIISEVASVPLITNLSQFPFLSAPLIGLLLSLFHWYYLFFFAAFFKSLLLLGSRPKWKMWPIFVANAKVFCSILSNLEGNV